jgi:hypothetical protein
MPKYHDLSIFAYRPSHWPSWCVALDINRQVKDSDSKQHCEQLVEQESGEFTWQPVELFAPVSQPTLLLDSRHSAAQELMDRLWSCGIRPTQGSGSAGSLAATERHLADIRTLLFHKEGLPNA